MKKCAPPEAGVQAVPAGIPIGLPVGDGAHVGLPSTPADPRFDVEFFSKFDRLGVEAASMIGVDAQLQSAEADLASARRDLASAMHAVRKNDARRTEQVERIELVKTHWFFGTTALQPQVCRFTDAFGYASIA